MPEELDVMDEIDEFWDDEENYDAIVNGFADIVSGGDFEQVVYDLLRNHGAGEWALIRDSFDHAGISHKALFEYNAMLHGKNPPPKMPATWAFCWLTEPGGMTDFVVIFFFDRNTMANNVAVYNRDRLFGIYGHS